MPAKPLSARPARRSSDPRHTELNRLLRALPRADYVRLRARLEPVALEYGTVLSRAHAAIGRVYFPTTAVVSLLTPVADEAAVEVALVGNDGMIGAALAAGAQVSAASAVVQISGDAYRLSAPAFLRALGASAALRRLISRYANTLLEQIAQSAACGRRHTVGERCARWLLMAQDRVGTDDFELTQEYLGEMLDVTRQSVNAAASALQRDDLIRYSRGRVTVTDRRGLEAAACACYRATVDNEVRAHAPGRVA